MQATDDIDTTQPGWLEEYRRREEERRRARELEGRTLAAEYYILNWYDDTRRLLGHDYGNGARVGELIRRARELERYDPDPRLGAPFMMAELAAAYNRVGARRDRRAQQDAERYGSSGARLTARAWATIRRRYARTEET